jgi:small subunit ribosomal protein S1
LHLTAIFREEERNVKTATEKSSSASAANASTLGDSTDVLAALKTKMERQKKLNLS